MFLLFGLRRGRRGRMLFAIRLALLVAFLIVLLAFHPHGTTLDILQAVRLVLFLALFGSAWLFRRRSRSKPD